MKFTSYPVCWMLECSFNNFLTKLQHFFSLLMRRSNNLFCLLTCRKNQHQHRTTNQMCQHLTWRFACIIFILVWKELKQVSLNDFKLLCLHTNIVIISRQLNGFNYCYQTPLILFIWYTDLFAGSEMVISIDI